MEEKPKVCNKCRILWPVYETMHKVTQRPKLGKKDSMEYRYVSGELNRCPDKCLKWLRASNCTINDDGAVNVNL